MRLHKSCCLFLAAFLICQSVFAQFNSRPGFLNGPNKAKEKKQKGAILKRLSLGYGQYFTYNSVTTTYQHSNVADTTFSKGMFATKSLHGYISTFANVARISERSLVGLDIGFSYTSFTFRYDTTKLFIYNKDKATFEASDYAEQFPVSIMSLPISFDYKWGGEASLNKGDRTSFAVGLGVAPSYITAETNEASNINVVPFVKAEAGFFWGLQFKLRGMINFGTANYLDNSVDNTADVVGVIKRRSEGPYGFSVALAVMPFSFMWDKPF